MIRIIIVLSVFYFLYRAQEMIYRRYWDKQLSADISFASASAFEGQAVGFYETVYNDKLLPLPCLSVKYRLNSHLRHTDLNGKVTYFGEERETLFALPRHRRATRKTSLVCQKRGYYEINEVWLNSTDVFFTRTYLKQTGQRSALTVFPREIEIADNEIPYKRLLGDILVRRFILPDPYEFTGVREYQPFDSLRQVNFKAWAKVGAPMSNTYGHTVSQEVCIVLNLQKYCDYLREGVFENAIRLAAFLARKYVEAGVPVSFVTNGIDCVTGIQAGRVEKGLDTGHLREIYEVLARLNVIKTDCCAPISSILPGGPALAAEGVTVALISSYAGDDLYEWYDRARECGSDVLWVAPCVKFEKADYRFDVTAWEVLNE